jgi:Domain of unknown function (DUF4411)
MYLMDSNTYISAKNVYYGMDFCPAYWDWLDVQFAQGQVASIQMVYDELANKGDELSVWVKARKNHFLKITDAATQQRYAQIVQHIYELPDKSQANVVNFADGADPWLIAKASVMEAFVVTQENLVPDNSKQIKIPNICNAFNVKHINSFGLLRRLQARFLLQR